MINVIQPLIGCAVSLVVGGAVKGFFWAKKSLTETNAKLDVITDNHMVHIQAAVEALPAAIKEQTQTLSQELRQQREDLRLVIQKL